MALHHALTLAVGLLGTIISFMVYLATLIPTIHKVYNKKSTEGIQSLPYVVELFSSMLWIYYGILKQGGLLHTTINSVGCVIEILYIALFLFYAPKKSRIQTVFLVLLIALGYSLMVILTLFIAKGQKRIQIVGWIFLAFNFIVFAAPLCILRKAIRTKSTVEFMPFPLSFLETLGAVMWFFYGLLLKDYKLAFPHVLGFIVVIVQMGLYIAYKNRKEILQEPMVNRELNQVVLQPNDHIGGNS